MKVKKEAILPAAREEEMIVQEMKGEVLVYDQRQHRAHCLNETAALVWRRLDGQSTASEVAEQVSAATGVEVSAALVEMAVEELRRSGLLAGAAGGRSGMSRREMMKRVGIGAAVALPVVASVVAPRAAEAANCLASGAPCSTSAQCCSGLCNGAPSGTCA